MSDGAEQAISVEADARYPRLTADGMRANRAFVAGAVWGRAEVAELVHQRGKLLDIAQEANDDCKRWRSLLAARDALIESQERQIAALTGSIQDINAGWDKTLDQLAEREAVIEQVRDGLRHLADAQQSWIDAGRVEQAISREAIRDRAEEMLAALDASPSTVLAEHDARVLEEAADELDGVSILWLDRKRIPWDELIGWLREKAAEYRKGAGQ